MSFEIKKLSEESSAAVAEIEKLCFSHTQFVPLPRTGAAILQAKPAKTAKKDVD